MTRYTIATNAKCMSFTAPSADVAATTFARAQGWPGVETVAAWEAYLRANKGHGLILEDGGVVASVRK